MVGFRLFLVFLLKIVALFLYSSAFCGHEMLESEKLNKRILFMKSNIKITEHTEIFKI